MGLLQDGCWVDQWYDTKETGGHFVRKAPQFRNWITSDGSAGPSGDAGFKAETGRYTSICITCMFLGASNIDFSRVKRVRKDDFGISCALVHG